MTTPTRLVTAYEHTCQRCGMIWRTMKPEPETCRRCKSYYWQLPKEERNVS